MKIKGLTKAEYYKEYGRQYREKHKKRIKDYNREYSYRTGRRQPRVPVKETQAMLKQIRNYAREECLSYWHVAQAMEISPSIIYGLISGRSKTMFQPTKEKLLKAFEKLGILSN